MTNSTSIGGLSVRSSLTPETQSVKSARQFVTRALEGVEGHVVDSAVLLTSELVTNSILHARSAIELTVTRSVELVRIEVVDESPTPPVQRGFSADASTGRGLQILNALATRWGVEISHPGKTVWFEIARPSAPIGSPADGSLVPITIVGLPIPIYRRATEQYDGVIREFRLIVANEHESLESPPSRLLELIAELDVRFAGFSATQSAELDDAIAGKALSIDIIYVLPPAAGEACIQLNTILDEADEYCREGEWLLSLVPSPEVIAFRRWFLAEFAHQIGGAPPVPFTESDEYRSIDTETT